MAAQVSVSPGVEQAALQLFGWWDLRLGDRTVSIGRREQRLVALLALTGRCPRDRIAGILWPDSTQSHALVSLRAAVWHTRRAAEGVLSSYPATSTLALAPHVTVDVDDLVSFAATLGAEPAPSFTDALACLEGKDLLPGWYDDWVLFERERIEHVRFRALETLAERCLAAGRPDEAALSARAALQIEPLHEGANLLLIRACVDSGSTAEAVRHFHHYRRRLEADLGIRPSPQVSAVVRPLLVPRQRLPVAQRRRR